MKRAVIIGFILFNLLTVNAQQLFFSGYNLADGLSQSVVNCILQDSKGYIWLGTQNGLNRFDGYTFKVFAYQPGDSFSISNRWIYSIAEDREGNLWLGTKGGLNRYIRKENRFERIRYSVPFDVEVTQYVYDVKCALNSNIIINTPPVLTICDPETMSFHHHLAPMEYDGSVKDCNIPVLAEDDGKIWMGSTGGLACFLPTLNRFEVFTHDPLNPATISNNNVTALFLDSNGSLWVGTSNGLNVFNRDKKTFQRNKNLNGEPLRLSSNFIRAIREDSTGKMWIATEGGGLNCIKKDTEGKMVTEIFSAGNSSLNHNIVHSLTIDGTSNLWIGTLSGINKADLKKQKFRLYRKNETPYSVDLTGNVIASLYKRKNDVIWVGTWGQGLNIYDRKSGIVKHFASNLEGPNHIPNDFVHTIFEDSASAIWIGTRDGLLVYHEQTRRLIRPHQYRKNPGLPDFTGLRIFRMLQSQNGDYWIATQDGLFRVRDAGAAPERFSAEAAANHRISANLVYGILEDSEGMIWIATTEGLDLFHPATGQMNHFRKEDGENNSLSDNFITALCEDRNGDIWIGTSLYLNRYSKKNHSFTYYSQEQGIPGNMIYSILEDKSNGLWVATGNGLCRFDPETHSFHSYSAEEGLQSPEFNLGASFLSPDGEVFFGGMNGFNSFYPDSLVDNPHIPAIAITAAFKTKNGMKEHLNVEKNGRIELNYNDYSFTIEFAALEYSNPAKNLYKYRLEGTGDEWIDIGNRNFVPFSNLPPGEYLFRVKGSNNDGLWNQEGATLSIRIHPPWWRSTAARIVYFLLIISLIYLIFKRREQQHKRDKKMLEEKVKERTRQIEEQKEEIVQKNSILNELNASKDKFFSIIAHDLRNPFNSITGLSDILLMDLPDIETDKLRKTLENIKGSSQQAHELLENLLLWARSRTGTMTFRPEKTNMRALIDASTKLVSGQAARKNIKIDTRLVHEVEIPVDKNMILTVLRNLLTNALKFSYPGGMVRVQLSLKDNCCILSIKDNGRGIAPEDIQTLFRTGTALKTKGTEQEPGTGLGLIICREFIEKHGGRIEVESQEGKGSEFKMLLPLNRK